MTVTGPGEGGSTGTGRDGNGGAGAGAGAGGAGVVSATVTASDIARLAGVGRAAVSNWRRRFDDFPRPVGGTSGSPLFALDAVEGWFGRHDRTFEVDIGDRLWQQIRAAADDPHLGAVVGQLGGFLLYHQRDRPGALRRLGQPDDALAAELAAAIAGAAPELPDQPGAPWPPSLIPLARVAATAADRQGHHPVFEMLRARYREVYARQLAETPPAVARLMVALAGLAGLPGQSGQGQVGTNPARPRVFDPACGTGGLLRAAQDTGARHLLGQDVDATAARLTAVGLALAGARARIVAADSLLADGFAAVRADAVLCGPPFGQRGWGHDELVGSPWWRYGVPPRGEPELAWVQHCLAHAADGAPVLLLMPAAAASRPAGRRIRANLLRAGVLRAVLALPSELFTAGSPQDLWLLRATTGVPGDGVLLLGETTADLDAFARTWSSVLPAPADTDTAVAPTAAELALPAGVHRVAVTDLLDADADVSPRRHGTVTSPGSAYPATERSRDLTAVRADLLAATATLTDAAAAVRPAPPSNASLPGWCTVGELARQGVLAVLTAPVRTRTDNGELSMLTAADMRHGRPASGRGEHIPGMLRLRPADVVCLVEPDLIVARVIEEPGALLGPKVVLLRGDTRRLDPYFLAGCLQAAGHRADATATARTSARPAAATASLVGGDLHRVRIPVLEPADQRELGADQRQLAALEAAIRTIDNVGSELLRLRYLSFTDHRFPPADGPPETL
ncbi:SAM-dependent methyltransferase [Frankia sp. Ag45/Mut15]|uniref:SAM-dependent methyltransferase n=1 Tax=Frankia umida TaxID=573489 RepID=A0ABT0K1S2_9ACTN|nr:N-6 DNA methylase [Frankia umida]MCK9877733.1 SAM-dependent methyltransferase [Frankia umida]